ncbi:sugar ABC transporter substrate-binding protein [Subtercola frigoramans]|uniref:ABC-type sugar transport system substrate-binding protein n=1 Tax=Subtercola frigoramans TaxID=120298 RepID=A0ABS2L0R0_9MICO|nr:sugar ABC transporter substrate-binding protein [Subtercola frigoramans]MBM7470654.1 ABC-type sugar transport system substrate-binding protein [Subtercola frigoramans]
MNVPHQKILRPLQAVAVVATLGLVATVSGCAASASISPSSSSGGASTSAAPLAIGFSPFNLQIPAFQGLATGLTGVAQSQGDSVLTADPKGDPSSQLQQLQAWVSLGQIKAIWVIPQAPNVVAPALTAAQAAGIVVLASGVPADYGMNDGQAGIAFSNVDNAAYGKALGEQTAKCIADNLGGSGQIVWQQSPSGSASTDAINKAFQAALTAGAPKATIVSTLVAKDRLGSQQQVLTALQANPGANVVVGADDESTLGAVDAFGQAGKDTSSTCITGAGGNDEALAAVKAGTVYADVAFDFQADLMQNYSTLKQMATDPSAPGKQLVTPIKVNTK